MRHPERRYLKLTIPSAALYVLFVFFSIRALALLPDAPVFWRAALAVLPVLPMTGFAFAFVRYLRECDEFQRLIELQAIAWAALLVALGFLGLGFLGRANVLVLDGTAVAVWVFPSLAGIYGLTKYLTWCRYR